MGARRKGSRSQAKGRSHKASAEHDKASNPVSTTLQSQPEAGQPETQADENQPESPYERRIANWTAVVGAFTIVLAIATAASGYVLWQTDHTLKDTMVFGQRAYVGINIAANLTLDSEKAALTFENFGQTPAKNVKAFSYWEFAKPGENLPNEFDFPERPDCESSEGFKPGESIIFPHNPVPAYSKFCPEEKQKLLLVQSGQLRAFYYGHITYRDVFNKWRRTNFCVVYYPAGSPTCDRHNEMDPDEKE